MPKQWYHWGPKRKGGGEDECRNLSIAKPPPAVAAGGCMGAVFQLFNSHHHHHHNCDPEEDGQAPRNNWEAEEVMVGATASLSSLSSRVDGQSNGRVSSSGSRTPSLVSRLMGLDPLPEGFPPSPRPLNGTSHKCQSLKSSLGVNGNDTPRTSLEGRRSDVDGFNRRLSLQVSCGMKEESSKLSRHSCSEVNTEKWKSSWKVGADENSTATMKQVTERVTRMKFGADITNKTGEWKGREHRRDEILLSRKSKNSGGDLSGSLRAKDQGQAPGSVKGPVRQKRNSRCSIAAPQVQVQKPVSQNYHDGAKEGNVGSRFKSLNPPRLNKKEERFVHVRIGKDSEKKCRKTPFSSKLRHGNEVHSLVPLVKLGKEVVVQKKAAHQPTKPNTTKAFKPRRDSHTPHQPPQEQPTTTSRAASTAELRFHNSGLGPDTDFVAWVPESDHIASEIEKEMVDKLVLDTLVALGCYGECFAYYCQRNCNY